MSKTYYSYCCGKYVERNTERSDLINEGTIPTKGYHCSRCKKPLTVYGNPLLDEDKEKLKEKNRAIRVEHNIRGNKVEVLPNGDLHLINKVYKKAEIKEFIPQFKEPWVIFDLYGNYLTAIYIEHQSGAYYIENEAFEERLKKAKLCAMGMTYYNFDKYDRLITKIDDFKNNPLFKQSLIERGWKFDKNGKIK